MSHCRTCRHWEQRYPQNKGLGRCLRVSTILFQAFRDEPGGIALSVPMGMREWNPPSREEPYPVLRTQADFGCVAWERATPGESPAPSQDTSV